MRKSIFMVLAFLFLGSSLIFAKANTVDLFANAMMTADIPALEKTLAPNFWFIGSNGHIRDKEHFIQEIQNKTLQINRITLTNLRETSVGATRLITANGTFKGQSDMPLPDGLMRYTIVLGDNKGQEQVVLFQITPVIATHDCKDGNCRIK